MKTSIKDLEYVDDYEFFRVNDDNGVPNPYNTENEISRLPMTPWILIQFRTAIITENKSLDSFLKEITENPSAYNPEKNSEWTTVSLRKANKNVDFSGDFYNAIKNANDGKGSLEFDNFFDNIEISDNGGLITCSMKLLDKEFSRLESIILKTVTASKALTAYYKKQIEGGKGAYFQISSGSPSEFQFRIRFGYSDTVNTNKEEFIDEANALSVKFKNRAKKTNNTTIPKMVIRSPWYYFQMKSLKFYSSEGGLIANIEGFNIATSIFDRLKIVERFALIEGTPKNLLINIMTELCIMSSGLVRAYDESGKLMFNKEGEEFDKLKRYIENSEGKTVNENFRSEFGITWPVKVKNSSPSLADQERNIGYAVKENRENYIIKIQLGPEPKVERDNRGRIINQEETYRNVKDLLSEFCSKVPPIYLWEKDNNEIEYIEDPKNVETIFTSDSEYVTLESGVTIAKKYLKPIPYTYIMYEDIVDNKIVIRVKFYYKRINGILKQEYVRKYTWRTNRNNIITQFMITSNLDFAAMMKKIMVQQKNGDSSIFITSVSTNSSTNNLNTAPSKINDFKDFALVHKVVEAEKINYDNESLANQTVLAMEYENDFTGTIEILGDPFYMFSDNIEPYGYVIYLDVIKNNNIYFDGVNSNADRSYLTGFYFITKISHIITSSGYKTKLDIRKIPNDTLLKSLRLVKRKNS